MNKEKCYRCGDGDLKEAIRIGDEVLAYICQDPMCGKLNSVELDKKCVECGVDFKYHYDHLLDGDTYLPVCLKCRLKLLKEYLNRPEFKEALLEAMKKPLPEWMAKMKDDDSWKGGTIPVPFLGGKEK